MGGETQVRLSAGPAVGDRHGLEGVGSQGPCFREASGTEGMRRPPPENHHRANPPRGECEGKESKTPLFLSAKRRKPPHSSSAPNPSSGCYTLSGLLQAHLCSLIGPRSLFLFLYALLVLSTCVQGFRQQVTKRSSDVQPLGSISWTL